MSFSGHTKVLEDCKALVFHAFEAAFKLLSAGLSGELSDGRRQDQDLRCSRQGDEKKDEYNISSTYCMWDIIYHNVRFKVTELEFAAVGFDLPGLQDKVYL